MITDSYSGFILPIWSWRTPATDIPEQVCGSFRVTKRVVKPGTAWPMCKTLGYDYCVFMREATLTLLQERVGDGWKDWMVDSPYEWYAMGEYSMRAHGPRVLVGGLGLGLILHHLTMRRDIDEITVVEVSGDVIQIISPYIPRDQRIGIIQGDIFDVIPRLASEGREFDTIIIDIWAGRDYEFVEDFRRLRSTLYKYYANALHLFHPFQKILDTEMFLSYLGDVKKPIRFVPEDVLHMLRKGENSKT